MDVPHKFIKKVTIKNFLSYKDDEIDSFHPSINLIIGTNGSGKTSFFKSIEFALTRNIKYGNQLFTKLCNDPNIKELSVSVEFSNNYVFTRKLYPQNEQYLINLKATNQIIYHHLLKYYYMDKDVLVPQGKINQLIDTSDKLRNELITFTISKNNIDELKDLLEKIMGKFDSLDNLRAHLFSDIEAKQEEQLIIEKVSKMKDEIKLIQSMIQWKKINSLKQRIKSKKEKYEQIKAELNDQTEDKLNKEKELNQLKQEVDDEDLQNGLFSEESYKELITKKIQLDLENEDYLKQLLEKEAEQSKLTDQINLIREESEIKRLKLEQLRPKFEDSKEKEKEMLKVVQLKRLEIDQLYSHDDQTKDAQKAEIEKSINDLQSESSELENHITQLITKRNECSNLVEQLKQQIEINETNGKEDQMLTELKNENLNNETMKRKLCAEIDKHKDSLNKYLDRKRNFYPILGRAKLKGKENLDKVIEMFKNGTDEEKQLADNYYGWFIDNISFDKTFAISIERTSHHYLHKHIVKDSNTANRLIKKFNEMKFDGTCEFVVLDLLKIKNIPLDNESSVYQPLIKYIGHEKEIERAVKHCFQRVYICRSIQDVIALKKDFNFVTLDGDLLLRKKSLNGGYIDKNKLWINQYSLYRICERFLSETTDKLNELKANLQKYENDLAQNCIRLDESEQLRSKKYLEKYELDSKLSKNEIELEEYNQLIKNYKHTFKRKAGELENLKSKLELVSNRTEMSESERLNKISILEEEFEKLTAEYNQIKENCNQARLEVKRLKIDLKENLLKQETDLSENLKRCNISYSILKTKSSSCQSTIKILQDSIDQMLKRKNGSKASSSSSNNSSTQDSTQKRLDLIDKKKQICQLEHTIEQIIFKEIELKFNLKNNLQMQKTYEDEINLYESQMEEMADKANRYAKLDSKTLSSKLNEYQNELAEIGSQATSIVCNDLHEQQYFTIYDTLKGHRDLMTFAIELFKDEVTVERTLQTLSLFFARFQQVFSLFKSNSAIQVQVNVPQESFVDGKISDKINLRDIWSQMNVSFNGEVPRRIEFCSGGQKTILSLCYLLSVLTFKPQPFLMIDETDQNLDEATCLKLGSILKEHFSDNVQFFFSSNRTYFATFADKVFKVQRDRNQSTLNQVELDYWSSPEQNHSSASLNIPEILTSQEIDDAQLTDRRAPKRQRRN